MFTFIMIILILAVASMSILYINDRYKKQAVQAFTFHDFLSQPNEIIMEELNAEKHPASDNSADDNDSGDGDDGGE